MNRCAATPFKPGALSAAVFHLAAGLLLITACSAGTRAPGLATTSKPPTQGGDARGCFSLAAFQYFNHMPDSGRKAKDPVADDPSKIRDRIKEVGARVVAVAPELEPAIRIAEDATVARLSTRSATPTTTSSLGMSADDANEVLRSYSKANCQLADDKAGGIPTSLKGSPATSPDPGNGLVGRVDAVCGQFKAKLDALKDNALDDIEGTLKKLVAALREQTNQIRLIADPNDSMLLQYITKSSKLADTLEMKIPEILQNPSVLARDPGLKSASAESADAARAYGLKVCG